jgi:hypothetical protein
MAGGWGLVLVIWRMLNVTVSCSWECSWPRTVLEVLELTSEPFTPHTPQRKSSRVARELMCEFDSTNPHNPMKTDTKIQSRAAFAALLIGAVAAALCVIPVTSRGQIFVANFENNTIGEYNATTGATINSSFISGLSNPAGIVLSGVDLFVTNASNNTIGEYNATTGATINSSFISSGLSGPEGIALSGGDLLVTNGGNNTIGEYNATTGATINSSFISSGLSGPSGIALFGGDLFVTNVENGTIGEYNATTGATINSSFISGLSEPSSIALSGGNLFVTNFGNGTIGEYNATTGATINSSLISGLSGPEGVVVSSSVPEPTSTTLLLLGMTAIFGLRFFVRRSA